MTKPVIVCVDDEKTVLKSLKVELKKAIGNEYRIEIAEAGEDAIELVAELLEEGHEVPLIISDYIMPDMKGDELLKRVHLLSPKTLKVMLTGQADLEAVGNAIKYAKLYRYIAKPWQAEDLKLTVTEAIYSYLQDKELAEKNAKLQQLNYEQAVLIAQLHDNENRLKQFLEAMPVGVFVADAQGKPYYMNSRAQQLLGQGVVADTTSEQLREVYQIYLEGSEQLYPKEDDILQRALKGESATADNIEIHQDDKIIPIEIWGTPIFDENGKVAYAIVAFQDITERKKAEAERERFTSELFHLNQSFSRFVPRQFLQFLDKKSIADVQLGDQVQQEMSVLFSDIRDFTTLSETMTPQENFEFINGYLSHMGPVISVHQGFIDKYIGDAIMALFSGGADNAVKAGIAMLHQLTQYNQYRTHSGYVPIQIGIGINTGSLMLGTVGEQNRMDSTVISDAVNLASRLETLTKSYGVSLLISDHTFLRLQNPTDYAIRRIDEVKVKGKSEYVTIYEVFDADPPELKAAKLATLPTLAEAISFYLDNDYAAAAEHFAVCQQSCSQDSVVQIYLQ